LHRRAIAAGGRDGSTPSAQEPPDQSSRLGEESANSEQAVTRKTCKQFISLQLVLYGECSSCPGAISSKARLWAVGIVPMAMELTPSGDGGCRHGCVGPVLSPARGAAVRGGSGLSGLVARVVVEARAGVIPPAIPGRPCRAVPCRAVPCRAVPCCWAGRAGLEQGACEGQAGLCQGWGAVRGEL